MIKVHEEENTKLETGDTENEEKQMTQYYRSYRAALAQALHFKYKKIGIKSADVNIRAKPVNQTLLSH